MSDWSSVSSRQCSECLSFSVSILQQLGVWTLLSQVEGVKVVGSVIFFPVSLSIFLLISFLPLLRTSVVTCLLHISLHSKRPVAACSAGKAGVSCAHKAPGVVCCVSEAVWKVRTAEPVCKGSVPINMFLDSWLTSLKCLIVTPRHGNQKNRFVWLLNFPKELLH